MAKKDNIVFYGTGRRKENQAQKPEVWEVK